MKSKEMLYIYVRVSTSEQAEKDLSIPRQKELGIKLANELGMKYVIFTEAGESASHENLDNRPELLKIIQLVKEGKVNHLFVFDQTRLSRNNITKALISESFKKQNVTLHTHSKRFDFNKSEDELTYKILEAIESYESSLRKARFKLGYVTANKKGRYLKGITPYGYKKDKDGVLIIDEEEKKVFLKLVDLYLNFGYGTNQLANWLNENFIPTKTSKLFRNGYTLKKGVANRKRSTHKSKNEWNPGTINTMFKNELYYGRRKFKIADKTFEYVKCDPIIDKETFDKIKKLRATNSIMKKKEDKYFYLLKNLLVCQCGAPLHGRIKPNRGEYTYRCNTKREPGSACKSRGINITKLNNIIWNAFKSSVFYHKVINQKILIQLSDNTGLTKKLDDLQKELSAIQKEEINAENKLKKFIKKELDTRIPKKIYDETLAEFKIETKLLSDNKSVCLANIKMVTQQLHKKKEVESELSKGLAMFKNSKEEVDLFFPDKAKEEIDLYLPCEKKKTARKYLTDFISKITVAYKEEMRKHIIEINFHKVGVKKNFTDTEPYKYKDVKPETIEIGVDEKVAVPKIELPIVSNEYFLNNDPEFRSKYENERLKSIKMSGSKGSKPHSPFHVQQNQKLYDADF